VVERRARLMPRLRVTLPPRGDVDRAKRWTSWGRRVGLGLHRVAPAQRRGCAAPITRPAAWPRYGLGRGVRPRQTRAAGALAAQHELRIRAWPLG
jgi:hypothetical protein